MKTMSLTVSGLLLTLGLVGLPGQALAYDSVLVRCESVNYRDRHCSVPVHGTVYLVQQISRSACREGRTWGYNRRGIWVSDGCAGEFEVVGRGDRRSPYAGGRYGAETAREHAHRRGGGQAQVVVCESYNYRYNFCPVGIRSGVSINHQISRSHCQQGRSWGFERGGIWVDHGCAAEFLIH